MTNHAEIVRFVADLAMKSGLICTMAGLLALLLRAASASARNLLWRCAILVLILLPIPALLAPAWEIAVLPDLTAVGAPPLPVQSGLVPALAPATVAADSSVWGNTIRGRASVWPVVVLLAVGGGCLLTSCRTLLHHLQMRRLLGRSSPPDLRWQQDAEGQARLLGASCRVRLRTSSEIGAGVTVGFIRPCIVLPEEARTWPKRRRCAVIAHELAHVRRGDAAFEYLVALATALYWYQPLVWLAINRLRHERERACDDLALRSGIRPASYAMQLMLLARRFTSQSHTPVHVGLFWRSGLKDRLLHILRAGIRRRPVSLRTSVLGILMATLLMLPLAATGFWAIDREPLEGPPGAVLHPKAQGYWSRVDDPRYSAAYLVERVLVVDGLDQAVEAHRQITSRRTVLAYYVDEDEFNELGYRLLYRQQIPAAIAVFKLNAETFSGSWNVHDSLGEALLASGDLRAAHASYGRSLALGSQNAKAAGRTITDIEQRLRRH